MPIDNSYTVVIESKQDYEIWRYMDLDKFESILKEKSLFFCRADRFSDPFEGSLPNKEADFEGRVQRRLDASVEVHGKEITEELINRAKKNVEAEQNVHRTFKKMAVVNCWHINNNENDLMWRLYLKSNKGVAIKSKVSNLRLSLDKTEVTIQMSEVRYLNYEHDIFYHHKDYPEPFVNFLSPLIHKRQEFSDEKELRLLFKIEDVNRDKEYWLKQPIEQGTLVPVNPEILIDSVILPPTADDVVRKEVEQIMQEYSLNKPLIKSVLSSEPLF